MKHLFHGSRGTNPKTIYETEDGLDIRFANSGALGQGIYFANNAAYSSTYAFPTNSNNEKQMFLCLVLVGESVHQNGGGIRIPPLKPGS
mmetsp:Transcript_34063/g.33258  ORF Transcript_34063/g.33258 Transcript_34063/m.33258 type:complete len:89 (-) Transcript_34063:130-396(-)